MSDPSQKLKKLIEVEGYDDDAALIADAALGSVSPAICMNVGCDYTAEMEPDQDRGWCEACGSNSMKSALVLAGISEGARTMQKNVSTAKAKRKVRDPIAPARRPTHPAPPAIYALRMWSVKKVKAKWYISQAARFDDKAQWSRPYETLQRATTAIARKMAEEVQERHKRHCEQYGIND